MCQDAVMEQVFANVNEKLSKDEEIRKRIWTYKQSCTPDRVIEYCRPLGDFLMHRRRDCTRVHPSI